MAELRLPVFERRFPRPTLLPVACVAFWLAVGLGCGAVGSSSSAADQRVSEGDVSEGDTQQTRLNVVFILADDLGWGETGCYGQRLIPTPNIDRLAREGMRFTQHYSGAPVCAPSRCVLLTGRHLGHAEIRGNLQAKMRFPEFEEGQHPLTPRTKTLPQAFQQAGYKTAAMGKWGLGPVGSTGEPARQGIDLFFGYNCQAVAHSYFPPHLWRNQERIVINNRPIAGHLPRDPKTGASGVVEEPRIEDYQGQTHAPDLILSAALEFLNRERDRPFFLYLPFIEPHVAMHPPAADVGRFPKEWDEHQYLGEGGYLPHPRPRAAYAAMISRLDGYVGRILEALDSLRLTDRTLVIFSSDNGTTHAVGEGQRFHVGGVDPRFFNSTAGLRGYKGSLYEGGIRVPAIARLPGRIPAGTVSDAPGYFADWFPTLCDAAGLERPADLDGESLWPVLRGGSIPESRRSMLWVFPEYGGQVAVRLGAFKVLRQKLKTKMPGAWEVYDLSVDRAESHDLADERGDLVGQAEEILRRETDDNELFPVPIPGVNVPQVGK